MPSKSDLADIFVDTLQTLKDWNEKQEKHLRNTEANGFYEPPEKGWNGDLFDLESLSDEFDREELFSMFKDAVADKNNPGVTGDLEIILLQGDVVASAERAFRNRHASIVRNRLHTAGRHRGHGHDQGVINLGMMGFIQQLVKLAKAQG